MIKKISDVKKFWLFTVLYWVVFWILLSVLYNPFFGFFENLFYYFNIDIPFIYIYLFLIIPLILVLLYRYINKLNIKFKNTLFTLFYILIPYLVSISLFFYAYIKMVQNFNPSF